MKIVALNSWFWDSDALSQELSQLSQEPGGA